MEKLSEVIRALECCRVDEDKPCIGNCPYFGKADCLDKMMVDALKLLKEYQTKMAEGRSNVNAEH